MSVKMIKDGGDGEPSTGPSLSNALGVLHPKRSHFTVIKGAKVDKQEKEVLSGTQLEKDDVFEPFYFDPKRPDDQTPQLLRPPYEPKALSRLCQRNNTLGQLVTAMEVNIDGTGWVIEKDEDVEDSDGPRDDPEQDRLTDWFQEPYPRTSFVTLRRKNRRDMESVGYSFMEVLRSLDGELMFLKHIPADQMRLVKLDDPVVVEQTVMRGGDEMKVQMRVRERRFAQVQGSKLVYFKEYAASRDVNQSTGEWAPLNSLPADERGTEVLYMGIHEDAATPYNVPRWINQVPSVLGSRKAEELNLDFFNSGGLPPALIFVQGGELTVEVRKQLQQYLSGRGSSYNRAGVVEVHSTGGSIDSPGSVRVTVERFGSERMQDSMFENYDSRCEERVRSSFRLPPIFVGKSQDYSYATAFASYTVAEAQVFQPEREEFDEMINNTIMRELNPNYVIRSLPLTVNDVQTQLTALGLVKEKLSGEGLIGAVNEATGMSLKVDENADMGMNPGMDPSAAPDMRAGVENAPSQSQPRTPPSRVAAREKMDTFDLMALVNRWAESQMSDAVPASEVAEIQSTIRRMDPATRQKFDGYAAMRMMSGIDHDLQGTVELVGAASEIAEHADCGA